MITVIIVGSIVGNAIICPSLIRFKTAHSAEFPFIDMLNATINVPLVIMMCICKMPFLKCRFISWLIVSWYVLFMYLTVLNLTVLTMDRYGALVHGFGYHSRKTMRKAKIKVVFVWHFAAAYTVIWFVYTGIPYRSWRCSCVGIQNTIFEEIWKTHYYTSGF